MATSMQFGPEWMRKGPNSKSTGGKESASATPSAATSPGTGPIAGSAASSAGHGGGKQRNGAQAGLANLSGPTPVVSPAVSSPGAFSFAAAAAAATAQTSERNGTHSSAQHGSSGTSDSDASAAVLNGGSAALAKDKVTREKLLSLYSSDRTSKTPSAEPSPVDAAPPTGTSGPERSTSTSRRKGASDRRPSAFAEFGASGGTGPLSPSLGGNEPRGLNARSTSGSSAGGFGSAGTSNWDKAEKERPGLFQRASSGALAGVNASSASRPLSPSVSRDRFSGIQGGVLSGVAPPARKRMDSSDGGAAAVDASRPNRITKGSQDDASTSHTNNGATGAGSRGRPSQPASGQPVGNSSAIGAFSDAFSSNRVRGRNASAAAESATSPSVPIATPSVPASQSFGPSQPIVPSGNPEGLSISARFARHKDRLPGEGPIGPPSDGSIGFGKSTGSDRRRERQTSQAKPTQMPSARGDVDPSLSGSAATAADSGEKASTQVQNPHSQTASAGEHEFSSYDPDLAEHASAVFGSLKLDEDDSPGLPSASALAGEQHPATSDHPSSNMDGFLRSNDARQHYDQHQQHPHHSNTTTQASLQTAAWSPETSMWLYRDMQGNVQGPFSSLMMQDWYSQQYFADDLLIKRQEDAEFKPLAQIVTIVGNALQPFLIPPSNWLHSPAPPRPAFDNTLGGEQSRFSDTFGVNRSWHGQGERQQGWPAPLALGSLGNGGPSPASPFGRPDIFSAGQGAGLRNQDDLISILRERELQEQRQAAAAAAAAASRGPGGMSLGQLDGFVGAMGRSGWGADAALSPSHWGGIGHSGLGQFGDVGLSGHQSPLVGDRPVFDNYGQQQRQPFEQSGSPWTNKASLAARSQFDSSLGGPRPMQTQWGEQQIPWNYSATTPDVTNRQMDFSEGMSSRNEAIKAADPIGTPRRARSPAPQLDVASANQVAEHKAEQHKSFEDAFPAPSQEEQDDGAATSAHSATPPSALAVEDKSPEEQTPESLTEAANSAALRKRANKKDAQKAAGVAATVAGAPDASQVAKTVENDVASPAALTTDEPRPEELWPQSPKAVEFASEPELSGMPALTLSSAKLAKDAKREQRSTSQRQSSEVSRGVPGSGEPAHRAAAARPTGASNIRVVSQEQFRRGKDLDSGATATQAPLSDWLNEGSTAESPAPASRPAPWAAKDDATPSTGPSLREIQEAEARRAEAKRAAEKAAARARMAASPTATEELPTTLSWGLASAPATKMVNSTSGSDAGTTAAAGPTAPAWNAGKSAPKKTLMEIQEEERKRAEKLKAAQASAARKAYADSAGRSTSTSNLHGAVVAPVSSNAHASGGGGAWSVVGAGGKPTTPSGNTTASGAPATAIGGSRSGSPLAIRPTLANTARTASVGNVSTPTSGSAWSVIGAAKTAAPASPSPASRAVSATSNSTTALPSAVSSLKSSRSVSAAADPNAPSPEFIKYCKDNLQGLSIKTDDFIDMLLQFPLDPSADVIEIIADTVYANSSTLDGRRFANDFVSKRKLDVQGRTGGASRWSNAVAGASGGMGNFGAGSGVKHPTASTASPFGAKALGTGSDPFKGQAGTTGARATAGGDAGFKVVKGKGAKKRT